MKNKRIIAIIAIIMLALGLSACSGAAKETSQSTGQKLTEQAFNQQQKAVPYPANELTDSLERRNLVERLRRQNDPDKVGYVYFISFGKILGYWTIKGKVSSTQSQMTTGDLLIDIPGDHEYTRYNVTAPGDDGSYGENEKGVFFFTTEGAMVQLPEDGYVYSDQPINIGAPQFNSK